MSPFRARRAITARLCRIKAILTAGTSHPRNRQRFPYDCGVGGGFLSGLVPLRFSEAWELFGLDNGVASLEQMRLFVGGYRGSFTVNEDPMVGCVLTRDTVCGVAQESGTPGAHRARSATGGRTHFRRRLVQEQTGARSRRPWPPGSNRARRAGHRAARSWMVKCGVRRAAPRRGRATPRASPSRPTLPV